MVTADLKTYADTFIIAFGPASAPGSLQQGAKPHVTGRAVEGATLQASGHLVAGKAIPNGTRSKLSSPASSSPP